MEVSAFDVEKLVNRLEEAELYTNKFGTFAKSDFELLMFTIYLDMLTEEPKDYEISVALGIPESKVRNLRLKSQLRYPRRITWEDEFEKALRKGFYNKNTQTVTIMIEDPAIQNMIKYQIEKSNGMVDRSLNMKHLVMPIDSVVALAMESERQNGTEEGTLLKIREVYKKQEGRTRKITRATLTEWLRSLSDPVNLTRALAGIVSCANSSVSLLQTLMSLIK